MVTKLPQQIFSTILQAYPKNNSAARFALQDRAFKIINNTTPAVSRDENRAAHGNVCVVDTCACGATRATNVNGQFRERGEWSLPQTPQAIGADK